MIELDVWPGDSEAEPSVLIFWGSSGMARAEIHQRLVKLFADKGLRVIGVLTSEKHASIYRTLSRVRACERMCLIYQVYHGHTLTKPISFRAAVRTVRTFRL